MNGLAESSFDADPASLSQLLVLQKMISNLAMWIEIVCLKSSLQVNFPSFISPDYKIQTCYPCRFLGPLLTSLLPTPPEVGVDIKINAWSKSFVILQRLYSISRDGKRTTNQKPGNFPNQWENRKIFKIKRSSRLCVKFKSARCGYQSRNQHDGDPTQKFPALNNFVRKGFKFLTVVNY